MEIVHRTGFCVEPSSGTVAVPQLVYPNSLELDSPMVTLAFLEEPIDFDSFDGKPVQVLFCLFRHFVS